MQKENIQELEKSKEQRRSPAMQFFSFSKRAAFAVCTQSALAKVEYFKDVIFIENQKTNLTYYKSLSVNKLSVYLL